MKVILSDSHLLLFSKKLFSYFNLHIVLMGKLNCFSINLGGMGFLAL